MAKKNKPNLTKPLMVWSGIFTALFILVLVISIVITQNPFLYYTVCSTTLGGSEKYLVSGDPSEYQYYTPDYATKADVLSAANRLNERICEEGFVLLKNDGTLPMRGGKVTVFGKNSVDLVLGGSGSNAGASSNVDVDLYKSLEQAGFRCNPELKAYYESKASGSGRPAVPAMGDVITGFPIAEAPLPYPESVRNSYGDYSDLAIVVLSRIGGEGYDLPRTMFWNGSSYTDWNASVPIPGARDKDDHYLRLDQNETDMLEEASKNFKKVVVVINSASPLELGFLDDPAHYAYHENICAALWIGDPGASGINALGRVLRGEVNPSGRTVDTYARDFTKDPTWYNFGNNLSADGNRYTYKGKSSDAYFVEYREGIYFGYRYYETRAFEAGGNWYEENVVYPFGYGLSYTTFSRTAENRNAATLTADGRLTFDVTVKNTGAYAGKDVVQLWYSAPYTAGGIEKSHIVLGDFQKTALIPAGGEDTVTLSLDVRAMASYDWNDANRNGFKGYELEAGEYTVYIANGSHGWAEDAIAFSFTLSEDVRYTADAVTGTEIENLFDDVSGHIPEYLSRRNNFENFSVLMGVSEASHREASDEIVSGVTFRLGDKESDPWYTSEAPVQSGRELARAETEVRLYDLIGKSYDDPLWEKLMDQLTVAQMTELISTGNFRTLAIESIDKPLTTDADGPMGFALFMGDSSVYDTCYYASECVVGSTWNQELAEELGEMIGNEGLVGNEAGDGRPYSGWYAPAVNLHRNQFGGRNFEYYSEDGLLSGKLALNVVKGAREKGLYTFVKHFALNEQETKRDKTGLITWANEQAMRESYFVPFELCVKEGGSTAVMSSFNRIGCVWTGGSYPLLTSLLREEWGFEGTVITDFNLKSYMDTDQMIRAGGDLNLSGGKGPTSLTTPTDIASVRRAAKNVLFTVANSCAMNGFGPNVIWGYTMPVWVIWLIVIDCAVFAAAASLVTATIVKTVKKRKNGGITL